MLFFFIDHSSMIYLFGPYGYVGRVIDAEEGLICIQFMTQVQDSDRFYWKEEGDLRRAFLGTPRDRAMQSKGSPSMPQFYLPYLLALR